MANEDSKNKRIVYKTGRKAYYPVAECIIDRWSPRAMSGEKISKDQLMVLFEAARWAPSSFNGQPWRFIYAMRGTDDFEKLYDLLVDFNKQWTKNAAALVLIISRKTFEKNENDAPTHGFDTGAAWENFALQGSMNGLVVHGMSGFDKDRARDLLKVPDNYEIHAMAAVGKHGEKEDLPEDLQGGEKPSDRKMISEIVFEGLDDITYS